MEITLKLVKYYSRLCIPCRRMDIVLDSFFKEPGSKFLVDKYTLNLEKIDVEECPKEILKKKRISTVPTIELVDEKTNSVLARLKTYKDLDSFVFWLISNIPHCEGV